jgi:NAD+ diphosphatase
MIHTFAGNPLDRADALRRDPQWLATALSDPSSRFLAFSRLNVLLQGNDAPELVWLNADQFAALTVPSPPIFLGLTDAVAHFAIDVSTAEVPAESLAGTGAEFRDCRMAAMALPPEQTGIVAQARSQLDWHARHQFCSVCGLPTEPERGGHVRRCGSCGAEHFPRTDPVAIMLIIDGERCLLGQPAGRFAGTGLYTALAGFIDQGESIEEAVRREVKEEAGIDVGAVSYHSSQPWPFPSSLMIGCHGIATSTDIVIDPQEMADVAWFSKQEVSRAFAGDHPDIQIPGPIAIAHHLIQAWIDPG